MPACKLLLLLCVGGLSIITDVGDCAETTESTIGDFVTKIVDEVGKISQNYSRVVEVATQATDYVQKNLERPYSFLNIFRRRRADSIFKRAGRAGGVVVTDVILIVVLIVLCVLVCVLMCLCGVSIVALAAAAITISIALTVGVSIFAAFL